MIRVEYFGCNTILYDISGNHIVEKMLVISWNSDGKYLWHLLSLYRSWCPEDRANSTINTNVAYSDVLYQFCQHIHGLSFQGWCSWLYCKKGMFQAIFFLPRTNLSEVCHNSYWREFWHGTFQPIFWWLLLFCANFSVSDCQHGIGCDGAFVYCWMSCLDLKNIEQLLPLQLFWFFLFCSLRYHSLTLYCSYFIGFPLIWRAITFYEGHRFSSFVHFLYFCTTYIFLH